MSRHLKITAIAALMFAAVVVDFTGKFMSLVFDGAFLVGAGLIGWSLLRSQKAEQ